MSIDRGDPAGRVTDRDISQAVMEPGMEDLDDGEGSGGDIYERIVPVVHWGEKRTGSLGNDETG